MPVSQLQKSRLQQPDVRSPLLWNVIGQDGSPISAQAIAAKPKSPVYFKQHQAVLPLERQSEKVVQDLINAAIGCITYLRGLIPEKSFCDMSYGGGSNEPQPQTQSGVASQGSDKTAKKKETGTRVKHIRRGFSIEADTLLDLIECGIFEALSKGYLKAFQLAVFLDIDHPEVRATSGKRAFSEARADTSDSDEGTAHLPKRHCYGGSVSAHDFIQFAPPRGHPPYIGGTTHLSPQNSFSRKRHGITNDPMLASSEKDKVVDGSSFETLTVGTAYTGQFNTQTLESICPSAKDQSPQKQNALPILKLCRSSSVVPALRLGELKIEELSKTAQESDRSEMYEQQAGNNQIKCECGGEAENMDSIQCDLCDKWQHCECYGFVGDSDSRIGNMHVCYTCLLGKNEPHLLKEMKSFTIARKIVRCLMRSTLGKTFHDIMKTLGIESLEQSVVTGILSVLTEKNYIWVFNPRKIATKRSPNKYRIVESGEALKSIEEDLLDPLVNISHHILEICYKAGVKVVTIYAFSIENFKRSKYEVDALMDIAKIKLSQLSQHGDLLDRYGAKIRILGHRSLVNQEVLDAIDRATELTKHNNKYNHKPPDLHLSF
ncbi:cis-prenyltransferase [Orbilia oligospora]|uniref:Cis-prenyltransferase n=1 Tax=Orbilia oligospora TaxID=2813651 RepID=A0A7C8K6C3_ORBOL|nr:cis-prenyltransferase [Orbilia oligospora]